MELLTLSTAELVRLRILQKVQRGFRRQRDAAAELGEFQSVSYGAK